MDEPAGRALISALMRSLAGTTPRRAHPADDRTIPAAREWLARWRPARAAVPIRACTCAAGRCAVCN